MHVRRATGRRWFTAALLATVLAAGSAGVPGWAPAAVATASSTAPFSSAGAFADAQYADFFGRTPSPVELNHLISVLGAGSETAGQAINEITHQAKGTPDWESVSRLYSAYFLRRPDSGGLIYWTGKVQHGTALAKVSSSFASSAEFTARYGSLTNAAFVALVYTNVLGRAGDAGGQAYWTSQLDKGTSRGTVMVGFSESAEYKNKSLTSSEVVTLFAAMLRRAPTDDEFDAAVTTYGSAGFAGVATSILALPEYAARYPAPGAPTAVSATADNGSATVTWTAPSSPGFPITSYVVTPIAAGTPGTPKTFVQTTASVTITGLTNGTSYQFDVAATNLNGTGAAARSNAVVPKALGSWTTEAGSPTHDGHQMIGSLPATPALKWKASFAASPSNVLAGGGRLFVTVSTGVSGTTSLYALSPTDGHTLWGPKVISGGTYNRVYAAYDAARLFIVNYSGLLTAVDAATGTTKWSTNLSQYSFTSAPTATGGRVYVSGAGSGGTVYAVDEASGALKWAASVENGDDSSPAVDSTGVYVSYACNQAYRFNASTGALLWHHTSGCEGGGGATTVLHGSRLYTRDFDGDLILNTANGVQVDTYDSAHTPAFDGSTGFYDAGATVHAVTLSNGIAQWSQAGDGDLSTPVVLSGGTAYVASGNGMVYGYNESSGEQTWAHDMTTDAPRQDTIDPAPGNLALTESLLLVPVSGTLLAYG